MSATVAREPICQYNYTHESGEFSGSCYLPHGHAGTHRLVDEMGMCMVNRDCRARRAPEAPTAENPWPMDWSKYGTREERVIPHNHA